MQVDEYRAAFDAIAWSDRDNILSEVDVEMARQDEKWGEQNHPDLSDPVHEHYGRIADAYKDGNALLVAQRNREGAPPDRNCAWDGILLEEVYEALAEEDPAKLRAELVQVAAVAVQWIAAIDRRIQ